MKAKEQRAKSHAALQKELQECQARMKTFRFQLSANRLKTVREVRATRKAIAQIHTILREQNQTLTQPQT